MSSSDRSIRDQIAQNDVTMARSYLELDVMEWFSDNEIPFAYEAFVIPSVVGPSETTWNAMANAIQELGNENPEAFEKQIRKTPLEGMRAFDALSLWNRIYDKHNLAGEQVTVPVQESLQRFRKTMVLPDFALYLDEEPPFDSSNFDYSDYDYLVEVSGLWGVGLPGESTEQDWWDWYRVSAVAFKEYIYRLLGLWEDVYWVIPNTPYIEGVSEGIPKELRDDGHYVIVNTTSADINLSRLEDAIGVTGAEIGRGLSPEIELFEYERPDTNDLPGSFNTVEWEYDSVNEFNVDINPDAVLVENDFVVFHGELGEVYVSDESVHVRESQWRNTNMILLREYVLDVLGQLEQDDIVSGLRRVSNGS